MVSKVGSGERLDCDPGELLLSREKISGWNWNQIGDDVKKILGLNEHA
jgi:hypothetical protein